MVLETPVTGRLEASHDVLWEHKCTGRSGLVPFRQLCYP